MLRSVGESERCRGWHTNYYNCATQGLSGGRTWWAHLEFTRINIEMITVLRHYFCLGPFSRLPVS